MYTKNKCKFMMFDIKKFYCSVIKNLLDDSINFAWQHVQIKRDDFNIIQYSRNLLLYKKEILWQNKNNNIFHVAVRAYDGSYKMLMKSLWSLWNCRLVSVEYNLANKFHKNSVGLYRDNGFTIFKILIAILQIKYVENSTNYLNEMDYA